MVSEATYGDVKQKGESAALTASHKPGHLQGSSASLDCLINHMVIKRTGSSTNAKANMQNWL